MIWKNVAEGFLNPVIEFDKLRAKGVIQKFSEGHHKLIRDKIKYKKQNEGNKQFMSIIASLSIW